jgi:hypothetical protein
MKWNLQKFEALISLAKEKNAPDYFKILLKFSPNCIHSFSSTLLPLLESKLIDNKSEVLQMLKSYQQSTRNLQLICSHLKNIQDSKVSNKIPMLKKILETSLLRIKQMLENNNCQSAFWMGNLKHRDIDGKEVCSQVPIALPDKDNIVSDSSTQPESTGIGFDHAGDVDDSEEVLSDSEISDMCENDAQTLALSL